MGTLAFRVTASAHIDAAPKRIYDIIADYRNGHPHIVPKQFSNMAIEKGGVGAGTIITFDVTVLGRTQRFRALVSEPEPGRVLVERNVEPNASTTTFMVAPDGASGAQVTITTEMSTEHGGPLGLIERFLATRVMTRMYKEELGILAGRARS